MKTGHDIDHDHIAIRAMLAEQAASDTEWDAPPELFALVHDPAVGYGVIPVPLFNRYFMQYLSEQPPHAVMARLAVVAEEAERQVPGLDYLRVAVDDCRDEPELARSRFPQVSARTVACGLVFRTEAWTLEVSGKEPLPDSIADKPDRVESLLWHAVIDDDVYNMVTWPRGAAAPEFLTWTFGSGLYESKQRVAKSMRRIVQVSARASLLPWPPPEEPDPGIFGRS